MRKLAVVVPTYNEAPNLDAIVAEIGKALEQIDYEIIIADDDSPDLTWQKAADLSRDNNRVRVLRRQTNRGLAPAVADGMALANAELVACIDGDLQHDSSILPCMLAELQTGKTIAVGSRYVAGGGIGKWSVIRGFASRSATFAASVVTGLDLKDPMSGYFMLRRSEFMKVRPELNLRGFKILLEIASRLPEPKIAEVPYTFRARHLGESKLTWTVILNYLAQLAELYRHLHPDKMRFLRHCAVAFGQVIINLLVFLAVVHRWGWGDWRASALATLVAVLSNFGWINWLAFKDGARTHPGWSGGYLRFAVAAFVQVVLTSAAFEVLFRAASDIATAVAGRTLILIVCQTISILLGMGAGHVLTQHISWRHKRTTAPSL